MDDKGVKIVLHASSFFAPVLVPLIIWAVVRDNEEVQKLALQALLFHTVMSFLVGVSIVFSVILIGLPFLIVFSLMYLYYPIKGIIKAMSGKPFRYPWVHYITK